MPRLKLGAALWSQASDWPSFEEAAVRAETLGFDHIWTWDHLYAIFGNPLQPIFEGYTAMAAVAKVTDRAQLGLFVGANTFRNPGLVAKTTITLDHISGGRAILGIGGAWFEKEHRAYGIDFGRSPGQRLEWLAEAVPAIRQLLDGESVTSSDGRYSFDELTMVPPPLQPRMPIMIGGGGERKTLRIVAEYADIWNVFGTPEMLIPKEAALLRHCEEVGRDPAAIERTLGCKVTIRDTEQEAHRALDAILAHNGLTREQIADDHTFWTGTPEQIAEKMASYRPLGFYTFMVELPAPYDAQTMAALTGVVAPMLDGAPRS